MKQTYFKISVVFSVLMLVLAGCSPSPVAAPASGAPAATQTTTASANSNPSATVTSMHFDETGEAPNYTITGEVPTIVASTDPNVQAFNSLTYGLYQLFVADFKTSLQDASATPIMAGSSLDVKYKIVSPPGSIISIKYEILGFMDGAAHPYHLNPTITFNLATGKELTLDNLFLPGSNYLQGIADYCRSELTTRNIGFEMFANGADPLPENYQNWNITPDGLMITFTEYQVAAYAAGPQEVTIPYSTLKTAIDPQSPLGKFIQ
jgi:hypothetical protein